MSQIVVTTRVDEATSVKLDKLAAATGRTRSWLSARALETYIEREAEFIAFVQEGVDALDRGDSVPHSVILADLAERRARRGAA
jgi:predicted transcriptional regulator